MPTRSHYCATDGVTGRYLCRDSDRRAFFRGHSLVVSSPYRADRRSIALVCCTNRGLLRVKVGALIMDNELLESKIERLEPDRLPRVSFRGVLKAVAARTWNRREVPAIFLPIRRTPHNNSSRTLHKFNHPQVLLKNTAALRPKFPFYWTRIRDSNCDQLPML